MVRWTGGRVRVKGGWVVGWPSGRVARWMRGRVAGW